MKVSKKNNGFTMTEILISIVLVSILLVGASTMQGSLARSNKYKMLSNYMGDVAYSQMMNCRLGIDAASPVQVGEIDDNNKMYTLYVTTKNYTSNTDANCSTLFNDLTDDGCTNVSVTVSNSSTANDTKAIKYVLTSSICKFK